MKQIKLSRGQYVVVDDEVYEFVNQHSWSAVQPRGTTFYAVRSVYPGNKRIHMHRLIWETLVGEIPPLRYIDHINRDGLDNRLANLRVVTTSENMANRPASKLSKTGERGIFKTEQRYYVELWKDRKRVYRRTFKTLDEAVKARDKFLGELGRVA